MLLYPDSMSAHGIAFDHVSAPSLLCSMLGMRRGFVLHVGLLVSSLISIALQEPTFTCIHGVLESVLLALNWGGNINAGAQIDCAVAEQPH
jgi:hypothetical protein